MKLILIRHGETDLNREGRIQGHNTDPLNEMGRWQAQAVSRAIHLRGLFVLYSSPVVRALQTAQTISLEHHVPVHEHFGLAEANSGDIQGLTGSEVQKLYPDFLTVWNHDASIAQIPGGESLTQVQTRAWNCILDMKKEHWKETVVAVTHNLTMISILCRALGVSLQNFKAFRPSLGSFTILDLQEEQTNLLTFNDDCHLKHIRGRGQI